MRRQLGFVFQDPYDSLDPRMTLRDIVGEPLRIHGAHRRDLDQRVSTALESVGLHDAPIDAYPAQYSGGGRQRIAIARALILDPEILLCDEPTSSLDVSVQAQILNLLLGLKTSRRLSVVFVSHDLDLIRRVADDIVVMYAGRVVEAGATDLVVSRPRHPYTVALLSAIPSDHPRKRKLGDRLAPKDTTIRGIDRSGCVYASRCRKVQAACREAPPAMVMEANDVRHACLYPENTHE
jgi:oligopeptide/dipeptide ABC transporter ATP-binding protein